MDRSFYPESDLGLYAHPGYIHELLEWLEFVGYKLQSDSFQDEDWHNEVSADWDGTQMRVVRQPNGIDLDPTWYPQMAAVYTFKRFVVMGEETAELMVQVIETICNSMYHAISLKFVNYRFALLVF